jgi:hypothetical protein
MGKCKHYLSNMSAYIDNELDKTLKSDFENHLKMCKKCQEEYNKILLISDSLKENNIEIPDGFMSSLKAKIAQNDTHVSDKKSIFTYVNFRTGSLVLALVVLLISFKSPIYKEFAGDSKYTGIENSVSTETKKENIDAKFVVLDKPEPEKEKKSVIQNKTFDTVSMEMTQKSNNGRYEKSETTENSNIAALETTAVNDKDMPQAILEQKNEQITLAAKEMGGGGGSSASIQKYTNNVKLTLTKSDECLNVIEKYFGDASVTLVNLSYENYSNFKNEISAFCMNCDEIIEDKSQNVNIEIFLS